MAPPNENSGKFIPQKDILPVSKRSRGISCCSGGNSSRDVIHHVQHHRDNFRSDEKHILAQVDQRPELRFTLLPPSALTSSSSSSSTSLSPIPQSSSSSPSTSPTPKRKTARTTDDIFQCSKRKLTFIIFSVLIISSQLSQAVSALGVFEIQLISLTNERGLLENGSCCSGAPGLDGRCTGSCDVIFNICLSHYQANIPDHPECTFGFNVSEVFNQNADLTIPVYRMPFAFVWPGDFLLVIQAIHSSSRTSSQATPADREGDKRFVHRATVQKHLNSSSDWTEEVSTSNISQLRFRFRVLCPEHQFGPGCSITCNPRDDQLGHYECLPDGSRTCMAGWKGTYCTTRETTSGNVPALCDCPRENGECTGPNLCKCRPGWEGVSCDKCKTHPGCLRGTCLKPFDCICHRGWGGHLCDIDLNFCSEHQPCMNGGTCSNGKRGNYTCTCPEGFGGVNCGLEVEDCRLPGHGCNNGGSCLEINGVHACHCSKGFEGRKCERRRLCPSDVCRNGGVCVARGSGGGVKCICREGFDGEMCQNKVDHCLMKPCINGGTCENRGKTFHCACAPGFTGINCATMFDPCAGSPCLNNGTCSRHNDTFACTCADGFHGNYCEFNSYTKSPVDVPAEVSNHFVVALVLGILMPLVVMGTILGVIWCKRLKRRQEKERERRKNDLAVISVEQVENDINKNLNLNNKKNIEKSSQKMAPEEVNLFENHVGGEGTCLSYEYNDLNFHRNQLHVNKNRHKPFINGNNAHQSKVPTKYKEINQDASRNPLRAAIHTEV